jgi:hypothetical protein
VQTVRKIINEINAAIEHDYDGHPFVCNSFINQLPMEMDGMTFRGAEGETFCDGTDF